MRHGYIEVFQDSQTDVWVQWLAEDGKSARGDLDVFDGVLVLYQDGRSWEYLGYPFADLSAWQFTIPRVDARRMSEGLFAWKAMARSQMQQGDDLRLAEGAGAVISYRADTN